MVSRRGSSAGILPVIARKLSLVNDPETLSYQPHGWGGFSGTGRLRGLATIDSTGSALRRNRDYFVKVNSSQTTRVLSHAKGVFDDDNDVPSQYETVDLGEEMTLGEYASLNAISSIVPGFCPRAWAWGPTDDQSSQWFMATDFLHLGGGSSDQGALARKLGQLHTTPAPFPPLRKENGNSKADALTTGDSTVVNLAEGSQDGGRPERQFGFPVPTYCGGSRQPNRFRRSWARFFGEERLLMILEQSEANNGRNKKLRQMVEQVVNEVVPRLLGDDHLGYDKNGGGQGIFPVIIHGDLWCGNYDWGRIANNGPDVSENSDGHGGPLIYDSSACYAHSEFELGIMKMFGGFGHQFYSTYHAIAPKTEPVEEYPDRVLLYELYHCLNHYALFGGMYHSSAVSSTEKLLRKYGNK